MFVVIRKTQTQVNKAMNLANERHSRGVGLEEMLFLLRKDHVRLSRLLKYLSLKEIRGQFAENTLNASTGTEEVTAIMAEKSALIDQSTTTEEEEGVGEKDLMNALTGKDLNCLGLNQSQNRPSSADPYGPSSRNSASKGKRVKACRDFLARLDSTGELLRTLDEDLFDQAKHQRNLVFQIIIVIIFLIEN
jgi:hypothetical protein